MRAIKLFNIISKEIIYGFNLKSELANLRKTKIKKYNVIYNFFKEVQKNRIKLENSKKEEKADFKSIINEVSMRR